MRYKYENAKKELESAVIVSEKGVKNNPNAYKCGICKKNNWGVSYGTKRGILDHLKTYHPVECPVCGYTAATPETFKQHANDEHDAGI